MESTRKILILRGAPGSGKTTYAKKLVKEQKFKRINRDDLRDMLNSYSLDKKDEAFITKLQDAFIVMAMIEGYNIVIDNTHAKQKYIDRIKSKVFIFNGNGDINIYPLKDYKYDVEIVTMDTPLEECKRRNLLRERVVPENVIEDMYKNING